MLHIDQSFKCEYSSSNFNFSSSAFNVAIYVAVFTTPFEWDNLNSSCLCHSHAILTSFMCHVNG